jgi:hypothetical protein
MKSQLAIAATAALASVLWASQASAQTRETVTESGPNRALLSSGVFALGVPYVASVIVATQSDHPGDNNLYIPVVGPWMDLADRGGCDNFGQPSCKTETGYKVLLVADGILQGIGALDIVGAFMFPETRSVRVAADRPHVFVSPYVAGGGYGVAALAKF